MNAIDLDKRLGYTKVTFSVNHKFYYNCNLNQFGYNYLIYNYIILLLNILQHWRLLIKFVQHSDAGMYECQVSTYPPAYIHMRLKVIGT